MHEMTCVLLLALLHSAQHNLLNACYYPLFVCSYFVVRVIQASGRFGAILLTWLASGKPALQRITGKLDPVLELQLLQNVLQMVFHGLIGDA